MRKFLQMFIQDVKMRHKLLITFIIAAILPITLVCSILINQYSGKILEQTYSLNESSIEQIKTNVTNYYKNYAQISAILMLDNDLMNYLDLEYDDNNSISNKFSDYWNFFKQHNDKYAMLDSTEVQVKIYTTNNEILTDNQIIVASSEYAVNSERFRKTLEANGRIVVNAATNETISNAKNCFTISRLLNQRFYEETQYTNILELIINEDTLYSYIKDDNYNKQIYIMDANDVIISSNDRESIGKPLSEIYTYSDEHIKDSTNNVVYEDKKTGEIVFYNTFDLSDGGNFGKMLVVVPTKSLQQQMKTINIIAIIVTVLILTFAFSFILFFSDRITTRLLKLVDVMADIDVIRLDSTPYECSGKDEIGQLTSSFEKMLARLRALIDEQYSMTISMQEMELNRRKAEINALQSQINPHFLYNIMESVSMSLWEKNDARNADMLQKYAKLIRKSAEWGDDNVTVAQELELVTNYLSIQKYRFEELFEYRIDISPQDEQLIVPKFTLLPLVENVFEHAFNNKTSGGKVEIFSRRNENSVELIVRDNGEGIPKEKLDKINNELSHSDNIKSERIGVFNVHRRLSLLNGDEYGLSFRSTEGVGTEVIITIPPEDDEKN